MSTKENNHRILMYLLFTLLVSINLWQCLKFQSLTDEIQILKNVCRKTLDAAESASNNAYDASSYASEAVDYASDAANNSFGNVCKYCP